jgi:hypothetical protein
MQCLLTLPCEIRAEFVGVWRRDVERCGAHARRAKRLGSAWSVTEALDFGNHVLIRFEQSPDLQDRPPFTIRISKAKLRVMPKAPSA